MSYRSFKRLMSTGAAVQRRGKSLFLQSAGNTLRTTAVGPFPTKALAISAASNLVQSLRTAIHAGEITTNEQYNLACSAWLEGILEQTTVNTIVEEN